MLQATLNIELSLNDIIHWDIQPSFVCCLKRIKFNHLPAGLLEVEIHFVLFQNETFNSKVWRKTIYLFIKYLIKA